MRIGVYGGSFNPCHLMHKRLVEKLLEDKIFDRIIVLPTGNFYKKKNLLDGEERIKMLEIMFEGNSHVIMSDYEFKNNLICTYRSLDYISNMYKGDTIYFILGSDNLLHFDEWKRYEYILDNYNLLVIKRKNVDIAEQLERYKKYKGDLMFIDYDLDGISSSDIRDLIKTNDALANNYLDSKVYDYIKIKGFYQEGYKNPNRLASLTDEEFLKTYDPNSYEKMSMTTDITLFGISDKETNNYRKVNEKELSVLLVKRQNPPFKGKWCVPGGFLSLDETLIDCAKRVLLTETNLDSVYLEQLYTFSDIDRDIRGRVLSVGYLGLVDINLIHDLKEEAEFFKVSYIEENNIITVKFEGKTESFTCKAEKKHDRFGVLTYKQIENEYLAFDHLETIITSLVRLKSKINYTNIVFHMMPKEFTLKELQLVYEAILGKKLLDPVFRRDIQDLVIKTEKYKTEGGHRPAQLFMYRGDLENE